MTPKLSVDSLQEGLKTKRLGRSILFSRSVNSTNSSAKKLAELGAPEGMIVIAETQTAGHGRLGREWVSPEGGLWFSIILKPHFRLSETSRLVFVASLAVAEALHELYRLPIETKWPNDVLVIGRKICGILAESNMTGEEVNYVIVGVGINGNFVVEALPAELRGGATSLREELGKKVKLEELFRAVLERFENLYDSLAEQGFSLVLERWKRLASFLGRRVEVTNRVEKWAGLALDIDVDGSLVLKLDDGSLKHVYVGDVSPRL